ncbi:helicase-associated domain-containing protein [Microbacterium fluvii]|uniref:Helicase-associated domain-containing protein n=1 Tax=Microbacterium fluvii TaxID=415215 RepID=A0ABW2HCI9_9MICO|nr:helicase-associated domain-containing protein [Microbacterium fluvii]MCU4671782.1 helicase-associated domain-containing protein [Microbacterium fluvii]
MADERALATGLSGLTDDALARTFAARAVSPGSTWHDFFDAAGGLLEPTSIDRALTSLPRAALVGLAAGVAAPELPAALLLIDADGTPFAAVTARVEAARSAHPDAFEHRPVPPDPTPAREQDAASAAELAFTTTGALADVLLAAAHLPLARTGSGAVSAVDRRRLVDAGAVETPEELDDLVETARTAGLLAPTEREWQVTAAGEEWLQASTARRWRIVADALAAAAPDGVRARGGILPLDHWHDAYPLRAGWRELSERRARVAVRWGLIAPSGAEPAWTAALRTGRPDAVPVDPPLPAEIDRVYLQADLTAISPGPLAPPLELRLRTMAHRESRAQASTYRFSADSLGGALTEGETAASIREFLSALSLTGIPQPLEYLIQSTASRHGRVRVEWDAAASRTVVTAADRALRDAIAVDQALRPLGLVADGEVALTSRVGRDAVYWALADSRYPVMAVDSTGAAESLHRRTAAGAGAPSPDAAQLYAPLIARLREAEGADTDGAWLVRELEQAVRARAVIEVAVRMPDDTERTFTIEATGLGGGRLRGRDRAADVERTLPVSHILRVATAP